MAQPLSSAHQNGKYSNRPSSQTYSTDQQNHQGLCDQDGPVVIVQPPVYVTPTQCADPVPDYMCYSRFTMLCCCLLLGSVALYYSKSTRAANGSGQREKAKRSSRTALILNHVAVVVGLVIIVLYILSKMYLYSEDYRV